MAATLAAEGRLTASDGGAPADVALGAPAVPPVTATPRVTRDEDAPRFGRYCEALCERGCEDEWGPRASPAAAIEEDKSKADWWMDAAVGPPCAKGDGHADAAAEADAEYALEEANVAEPVVDGKAEPADAANADAAAAADDLFDTVARR